MGSSDSTTHYATLTRVAAIAWTVIAVLLLLDVLWRGEGRAAWTAGAVLVATVSAAYLVWLRPRVVSTERGLRVINPLRETFVPWAAVLWVDVTDVLRVHTPGRIVRSWPLRETKRQRVRDNMRRDAGYLAPDVEEDPVHDRPVERVARQLRQDAERYKTHPLSGPIRDVDEAGPAALGAQEAPQTMVPVEVIVVITVTAAFLLAVFLLA